MESEQDQKQKVTCEDLQGLLAIIDQYVADLQSEDVVILDHLKHIMRGLACHEPKMRTGYVIILNSILNAYNERIEEQKALDYIRSFPFAKKNAQKKSKLRTAIIARILAYTAFIKSGVIHNDEIILQIIEEIFGIGKERPQLQESINIGIAQLHQDTEYKYLEATAGLIPSKIDGFIFWFHVSQHCPADKRHLLPEAFRPSAFNENTAEKLSKTLLNPSTKQPWTSQVWRLILNDASDEELITYWPLVFSGLWRLNQETARYSNLSIVRSVLDKMRPTCMHIVVSSVFIKMVNGLLTQTKFDPVVADFLQYVSDLGSNKKILPYLLNSFAYIDPHLPNGFNFFQNLFDKCSVKLIREQFQKLTDFGENDRKEYKNRMPSDRNNDRSIQVYRLDKLRALFISSALHPDSKTSIDIFDYIFANFKDQISSFITDLVAFDTRKVEGAATFQQFLQMPELSHFDSCYKLYSMCANVSSSPSLDTLVPPPVTNTAPSADFILTAAQNSNEPPLIRHAYQTHLRIISPQIPPRQLEQFFNDYVPAADTFSQSTIDMFKVVSMNCQFTYNLLAPLFNLFIKTITNCGQKNLASSITDLINELTHKESQNFAFPFIVRTIFTGLSSVSNRVLTQNERLIYKTFEMILNIVIKKSLPLSPKNNKSLEPQLEMALTDFAFKTNPHFGEEIFSNFIQLPEDVPHILFPLLCKHLPNVKRVHRRVMLLNMMTTILATPRGLDVLQKRGNDFNKCILSLLSEDYSHQRDDERKFLKTVFAINKWLQFIEKRRSVCGTVNVGDIRRKVNSILPQSKEGTIQTQLNQILTNLQKVEGHVHVKQRVFT